MAGRGREKPITQYVVGRDITQAEFDRILEAVTEWFREYRPKQDDPAAAAKHTLDCCLRGVKVTDGTPWYHLGMSSLATRIRAAAAFDIEKWQPIRKGEGTSIHRDEIARRKLRRQTMGVAVQDDAGYAREIADADKAVYGDNPITFFTTQELKRRDKLEAGYLKDFPQLANVASRAKLDTLLDMVLLLDRLRFRVARDESLKSVEYQMSQITKQIVDLEKALNIHPDQLAKQQKDKEGGTIGDAVRRLEEAHPLELRERWFLEELLMLYQMYNTPSPRQNMGGFQLDEVGLFGMTRCRTCSCSSCGTKNYAGLSIEEIETHLLKKGRLKRAPLPVAVAESAPAPEAAE